MREIVQGEVYWYDFGPAIGSAPADRWPCVVVQGRVFNQGRIATTVVCLITSNMERAGAPGNVALLKGEAGLPRASVVNVSQLFTVNKYALEERVGQLRAAALVAVLAGVWLVMES